MEVCTFILPTVGRTRMWIMVGVNVGKSVSLNVDFFDPLPLQYDRAGSGQHHGFQIQISDLNI